MKNPGMAPSDLNCIRPYCLGDDAGPEEYRFTVLFTELLIRNLQS